MALIGADYLGIRYVKSQEATYYVYKMFPGNTNILVCIVTRVFMTRLWRKKIKNRTACLQVFEVTRVRGDPANAENRVMMDKENLMWTTVASSIALTCN